MKNFRVLLMGEADGVVYGVKEFAAEDERHAALLADELCVDWWGNQRLVRRLMHGQGISSAG